MSTKNIDRDRLFKELITTFFIEFLELFFPKVLTYLDQNYIEFSDKEVFTEIALADALETDIVVKTKFQGKDAFFRGLETRFFEKTWFLRYQSGPKQTGF